MGMLSCTESEEARCVNDFNRMCLSAWLPLDISSEPIILTVQ